MPEYTIHELSNGIRWVHRTIKSTKLVHIGVMQDIGSRDEHRGEEGIVHFWEHMAFKGTSTIDSKYILHRIDSIGGELNAYTTKEKICFHASLLHTYVERGVELLAAIVSDSVFPAAELAKEREVILDELTMYEDSAEDAIQDLFDEVLYGEHPLGVNILGKKESLSTMQSSDLKNFVRNNQSAAQMVISTVGNIGFEEAHTLMERHFSSIVFEGKRGARVAPVPQKGKQLIVKKHLQQAHTMMGVSAYGIAHAECLPFFVLANYLGGPAMNSKLNLSVREEHGLVYHIETNYVPFTDSGLFSIYFGSDTKDVDFAKDLIWKELDALATIPLSNAQLDAIKVQVKGQLAMSDENNNGYMLMMAKNLLDMGRIHTLEEIYQDIDLISPSMLLEISRSIFDKDSFCELQFVPEEG